MNRREFLLSASALCVSYAVPTIAHANTEDFWTRDRTLWLRRQNTGEQFRVVYWSGGRLDPANYIRICYLLRDSTTQETVQMDVNLLHLMYGIQYWQELLIGRPVPLISTSGHRIASNNSRIEGAAKNSMHLYGKASDVKSDFFTNDQIADQASFFSMGGVGRYSTHTHIDTWLVRHWDKRKIPSPQTRPVRKF